MFPKIITSYFADEKAPGKSGIYIEKMHILTIGHSNRSLEEFVSCLKAYKIKLIVDVRRFPKSSHCPHFSKKVLQDALFRENIEYQWWGDRLGGYRSREDGLDEKSPNKAWETEGFRIYADYMMGDKFSQSIREMLPEARESKTALMCAEKFYWRCHRRLISDFLIASGHKVTHIINEGENREHQLPEFAHIKEDKLSYPLGDE